MPGATPTPLTRFSKLHWEARFVERLPGDPIKDNYTRAVRASCYSEVNPTAVRSPELLAWSDDLGAELGIARPLSDDREALEVLAGNRVLTGMRPYAARYGGHQFGNWAGQLGDGRAITLGEVATATSGRVEFQLKGSGPTPYSRRADGRAVLRSSIREFLCSEAMHCLGVPTTRALSLVSTGDAVERDLFYDGNARDEPGAIVCRVSPSFLRFGNFEILASNNEPALLKQLTELLIHDHFPGLDPVDSDVYGKLLDEVARRTALMVTHWLRVGFVHGVMNTDNMSMLGLTIDYGPYGWLEPYDPGWTPNTTDAQGRRYCYGNQAGIGHWNVARLCEAFIPLVEDQARLKKSLAVYKTTFETAYTQMLSSKLGLELVEPEGDQILVTEMFELLAADETDYTIFFRALCDWKAGDEFLRHISPAFYSAAAPSKTLALRWAQWAERYAARLLREPATAAERSTAMKRVNPKFVLRNYLAQNAITAATTGDLSVLQRLLRVLKTPYDEHAGEEDLALRRPEWARNAPGCSALSCSS